MSRRRRDLLPTVGRLRALLSHLRRPDEPMRSFVEGGVVGDAGFGARGSYLVPPVAIDEPDRVVVGRDVVLMEGATIETGGTGTVVIGDGVRLGRFAAVTARVSVEIGDAVSGSDFVTITDGHGPGSHAAMAEPVVIEHGAYLGGGCVIGPGVRVGRGAFVGEGAVVLDDVPPHTVVFGNPARVVRRHDPAAPTGWKGAHLP